MSNPDPEATPRPLYGLTYFGWLLIAIAVLWSGCSLEMSRANRRFQDDNAIGATANAIEDLRDGDYLVRPGELLIIGLLMVACSQLAQIRDAIRERQ